MTDLSALAEPFPPDLLRRHESKGLTYVPVSEVIARLNRVCGPGGWSYRVERTWEAGEVTTDTGTYPAWIMAQVSLTLHVDFGVQVAGVGGQQVKFLRSGQGPVDLGDEYKGAVSDALKKAAQHLGVGLDLARKDEALDWEAAQAPPAGWASVDDHDAARAALTARAQALPAGLGDALKLWWRNSGMRWPLTRDQADTFAAKIAEYEAKAGGGAGVEAVGMVADLEAVLDRMDPDQLAAVGRWADAQGVEVDEAGRPHLNRLDPERLEALYQRVAVAS